MSRKCLVTKLAITSVIFCSPVFLQAQDYWAQWRGPNNDGNAGANRVPLNWSESENVLWRTEIPGEGSSTPIIWGDKMIVLSALITDRRPETPIEPDERARTRPPENIVEFWIWCLDRNSGDVLWKKKVQEAQPHEGRHKTTTYAAASPVTDGKYLFASFGSYGIYCLTMDGELVWSTDLGDMRTRRGWGEAVSPVLADGRLIVMWDQEDQSHIYVLNSADGSIAWQRERDEPTTWATPLVVNRNGKSQIVTSGTNQIRSYELEDGDLLWETGGLTLNAIPSPVLSGDHVILMSGYRGNAAVSVALNDTSSGNVKWKIDRHTPYVPSPLLTNGRLYFTKGMEGILSCVDVESGEPLYDLTRLPNVNNLYASPVATDEHVYFISRDGVTLVIANSPTFEVVATNRLEGQFDASPAIVDNHLYLRSKTHVYCIAEPNQDPATETRTSVKPGINDSFLDPDLDVERFVQRFELESREVYACRQQIVRESGVTEGMVVADIGAGTGLFSRMFARQAGPQGWVYAVDIAPRFVAHIRDEAEKAGLSNLTPVLCDQDSVSLPANSVDLAFICDTYHHFEYPQATMKTLNQAVKSGGTLVVIDFERIPGKSREWLLGHVRAGKSVFRSEIEDAGFEFVREAEIPGFQENYYLVFRKK